MKATIRDFIPHNEWNDRYDKALKDLLSIVQSDKELLISGRDSVELQKIWNKTWEVAGQGGELSIAPVLNLARAMALKEEKRKAGEAWRSSRQAKRIRRKRNISPR